MYTKKAHPAAPAAMYIANGRAGFDSLQIPAKSAANTAITSRIALAMPACSLYLLQTRVQNDSGVLSLAPAKSPSTRIIMTWGRDPAFYTGRGCVFLAFHISNASASATGAYTSRAQPQKPAQA